MVHYFSKFSSAKKMRHAILTIFCLCCLILSGCHLMPGPQRDIPAAGTAIGTYASPLFLSTDKHAFAAQVTEQYWNQNPDPALLQDTDTMDQLILQAVRLISAERAEIHEQLTAYGIYAMPYDQTAVSDITDALIYTTTATNYTDSVYLWAPTIYYQVPTDQWIVAFGGTWINDDWKLGKEWGADVGGMDTFGVNIEDRGNDPGMICTHVCGAIYDMNKYTSMEALSAYETDGSPKALFTGNRANGVTANGYGFQLQDSVKADFPYLNTSYMGYQWAGLCVYSTEFADLDATLTAYYIHTYGTATGSYDLSLGQENALSGELIHSYTGEPVETMEGYFVRYSNSVVLSPAP